MSFLRLSLLTLGASAIMVPSITRAVTPGQVDTFEGGIFQGWMNGFGDVGFETPLPVGGPGGASDHFMSVTSGSYGGRPRWIIFNRAQWKGDYVAAGVRGIVLDLKNQDMSGTVKLRLAVLPTEATGADNPGYVSNDPISVPADGAWHRAVFLMTPAQMTLVFPPEQPLPLNAVLSDLQELRLLVQASAAPTSIVGDNVNAKIGVDNITAIPLGDFNLDGVVTNPDLQSMLDALKNLSLYKSTYGLSDNYVTALGDFTNNGVVDMGDVPGLLGRLTNSGGMQGVPEPFSMIPAACALAALCWIQHRRMRFPH